MSCIETKNADSTTQVVYLYMDCATRHARAGINVENKLTNGTTHSHFIYCLTLPRPLCFLVRKVVDSLYTRKCSCFDHPHG